MRTNAAAIPAIVLLLQSAVWAHRLDEYMQATILSVEKDRSQGSIRLIPASLFFLLQ